MDERSIINRIKDYRKRSKLTLQELADVTGFTKSYLSQIENSEKAPPIGTVTKIAEALGVDPVFILVGEEGQRKSENISLVRKSERKEAPRVATQYGYLYETLAHMKTGKAFETYMLTLPFEKNAIFMHEGEEMVFILEGRANFIYGEENFIMEEGDCVHFNAAVPHTGISIGDKKAKALCIISAPKKSKGGALDQSEEVLSLVSQSL